MCGIYASVPANACETLEAIQAMAHRGPDQIAVAANQVASLGICRLAITDVDGGYQPIRASAGGIEGVFNGAVFFREGHCSELLTTSGNDGALLVELWHQFGEKFADSVDGMYAVALRDDQKGICAAAVDPIGIKPLYHCTDGSRQILSSTIAAVPANLRPSIRRLAPGYVWCSNGTSYPILEAKSSDAPLLDKISNSVRKNVPSEVPWACFASGGLDSSLVAAFASHHHEGRLPCYTIDPGIPSSDLDAAAELARCFDIDLRRVSVSLQDLQWAIESVVQATAAYTADIVINGVGTYLLSRQARDDGIRVVLTGDGADELFGGYDEHAALSHDALKSTLRLHQQDLGATECVRLDRCTMAFGVEARVPFLSTDVVAHARSLPPEQLVSHADGVATRKVALRDAASTMLPPSIANRPKDPLYRGSGIGRLVEQASSTLAEFADNASADEVKRFELDHPLEPIFFGIWKKHYAGLATDAQDMRERGLTRRWGVSLPVDKPF